ncbi:MAG TPA: ACP S-malonyltransferase [Planctomycetota bacterium]|nr:ACP S-malonyltransferase [Planctomycetota bacterium]
MAEALIFPGQGAQHEGMGRDWCGAFPAARATFEEASGALGFSISEACWSRGEQVHRTDIAQPGILTTSAAIVRVLIERGLDPASAPMAAGLSLGEYTALWFAGSLEFRDALRLVRVRGEAMQEASEEVPSGMVSLLGAGEDQARALAEVGSRAGICSVANLNAPGQVIVSGELAALDAVEAAAKEHGVRRTRRLQVAGGFHSECMRSAARRLRVALEEVEIREPRVRFVTNVTGEAVKEPERIREFLAAQVCSPVLWEKSVRGALASGVREFLEPGPGRVLSGLMEKIEPAARVRAVTTPADLEG